ncbi:hypothetical protein F383_27055 [Gossypium arboreum]|uniref:Uncharacterized protein n=1 Tax=Gossypium arboreum TaxID=29729 RepID=A0A0B0PCC9_GOSAR|nr:hypothetical protein F383_27055 [Gossypium arboreum]
MRLNIHSHIYTYSRINSIIFISFIHKAEYTYHVCIHSSFTSYRTYITLFQLGNKLIHT